MSEEPAHWADDPYWTDALAACEQQRAKGVRFVTIDFDALDRVIYNGEGPAYKLMNAMIGVKHHEWWEGHKGAPRVLLASLMRLAEASGTTGRISSPRRRRRKTE
jgi:hypothetical protein